MQGLTWSRRIRLYDAVRSQPRATTVALMQHLRSYSEGAGPHIRVGGNTADQSEFAATVDAPLSLTNNTRRILPSDLAALAASVPLFNGSVTLALNFRDPVSPALAVTLASAAMSALDSLDLTFEVGNEPVRAPCV